MLGFTPATAQPQPTQRNVCVQNNTSEMLRAKFTFWVAGRVNFASSWQSIPGGGRGCANNQQGNVRIEVDIFDPRISSWGNLCIRESSSPNNVLMDVQASGPGATSSDPNQCPVR